MNAQPSQPIGSDIFSAAFQPLIDDPAIIRVMVDGYDHVYVERDGRLEDVPSPFRDEAHLMAVIHSLARRFGRTVDETTPLLDVRLPDSSRVNVVLPPISLTGPLLTLGKFHFSRLTTADLVRFNCLSEAMLTFLQICVQGRLNIVVSGGVSSGKTTLLNLIAASIPPEERIVTVQEVEEFFLNQPRVVKLESRPADIHGRGGISARDLVNNALRMRPDRIILAEARGAEFLELINAILNGHDGTLVTVHASSLQDTIARLENAAAAGDPSIPLLSLRQKLAAALDLIVRIERMPDGSRKVLNITHVNGIQDGVLKLQNIFEYRKDEKCHLASGYIPAFVSTLQEIGFDLPVSLFTPR